MIIGIRSKVPIRAKRLLQDPPSEMRISVVLKIGDEIREQEDRHAISSG
jgi:hypothetical protein